MYSATRWLAVMILAGAVGACGPFCGSGKLNLANAHVTSSFGCPKGADNQTYNVDGSVDADNQTGGTVNIKSMAMDTTVVGIKGNWGNESMGSKGNASGFDFSPKTVNAGSKSTIKFSTQWTCSDPPGSSGDYADFSIQITLLTSAGTLKIGAGKHRLEMA